MRPGTRTGRRWRIDVQRPSIIDWTTRFTHGLVWLFGRSALGVALWMRRRGKGGERAADSVQRNAYSLRRPPARRLCRHHRRDSARKTRGTDLAAAVDATSSRLTAGGRPLKGISLKSTRPWVVTQHVAPMRHVAALLILAMLSGTCRAEVLCAIDSGPLYEVAPKPGQPLPAEVGRLQKGHFYQVIQDRAGWTQLNADSTKRWVEQRYLGSQWQCLKGNDSKAPPAASENRLQSSSPPSTSKNQGSAVPASGCTCSSGQVCTGPRGGRYCITSGGNKRYGV